MKAPSRKNSCALDCTNGKILYESAARAVPWLKGFGPLAGAVPNFGSLHGCAETLCSPEMNPNWAQFAPHLPAHALTQAASPLMLDSSGNSIFQHLGASDFAGSRLLSRQMF
jgi:hypothetical protein